MAFVDWCNEHGGILGRQIFVDDADAKLIELRAGRPGRCDRDFAMVGGGAVLDDDTNGVRVGCGLANIAGYVVSEKRPPGRPAGAAGPEPVRRVAAGRYQAAKDAVPGRDRALRDHDRAFPSTLLVRDQLQTVAEDLGFTVDYSLEYAPQGETGWDNFANDIKDKGIKILEFVGQPADLVTLDQSFETAGYRPDVILLSTNFYDSSYAGLARGVAGTIFIQSGLLPARAGRRQQGHAGLPGPDGAVQPGRQDRPARAADAVGAPPLRPGGHRVRVRAHRATACSSRPRPRRTGPAGACTPRQTPGNTTRGRAS